jgi:hypothetical protein
MANPDVSLLTSSFVEFGGTIFGKKVIEWDVKKYGIQVRTNVKAPQVLTKLSAVGGPQPYSAADSATGNGVKFTDRTLTAYLSKWDSDFDPEQFRNTYLANARDGQAPFADEASAQICKEYLDSIYRSVLWSGVRNGAGTAVADIATGWGTLIAAEITATTLTPVATGALTNVNAVTKFELVAEAAPIWMQEQGFVILCSFASFRKYVQHYRTLNGFQLKPNLLNDYPMDGFNAVIRPVGFMGSSSRLVATVDGNLVFGTDVESIQIAASMRRNIIETRPMMSVGCQIQDLDALLVNDQA